MSRPPMNIKLLTAFAALALCVFIVPAYGISATNSRTEEEAAIRENVKQMETGWNTKKGALFAKPFAEDADYVVINGMYMQGRAAIAKGHQQIFDTFFKNSTIRFTIRQIRFLRPDVAVVHVTGHLDVPENKREPSADASITLVMTRETEGWQIAAFQNTQVTVNQQR